MQYQNVELQAAYPIDESEDRPSGHRASRGVCFGHVLAPHRSVDDDSALRRTGSRLKATVINDEVYDERSSSKPTEAETQVKQRYPSPAPVVSHRSFRPGERWKSTA